jgi:hypothetical protein
VFIVFLCPHTCTCLLGHSVPYLLVSLQHRIPWLLMRVNSVWSIGSKHSCLVRSLGWKFIFQIYLCLDAVCIDRIKVERISHARSERLLFWDISHLFLIIRSFQICVSRSRFSNHDRRMAPCTAYSSSWSVVWCHQRVSRAYVRTLTGTRHGYDIMSFTPRPLYPQGKSPPYALDRRLSGPQNPKEKILDPTGTWPLGRPARSQSLYRLLSRLLWLN